MSLPASGIAPQDPQPPPAAPPPDAPGGGPVEFIPGGVPRRYGDVVQLWAVLVPLAGPLGDDDQIAAGVKTLEARWRARVIDLAGAGWPGLGGNDPTSWRKRRYALNCRPSFVVTPQETRCCRHRQVCPFCWARWVREVWVQVDHAFFNESGGRGRSDYDLLQVHRAMIAPRSGHDESGRRVEFLPGFISQRTEGRSRELAKERVFGGFETVHVGVGRDRRWKVDVRQIAMVKADFPTPVLPPDPLTTCRRIVRPRRRDVVRAVATCCRYPTFLMRADPAYVLSYLAGRKGKKLSAMFGRFRNGAARAGED